MKNAAVSGNILPVVKDLTNPPVVNGVAVSTNVFTFSVNTVDELALFIILPVSIETIPTNNAYVEAVSSNTASPFNLYTSYLTPLSKVT